MTLWQRLAAFVTGAMAIGTLAYFASLSAQDRAQAIADWEAAAAADPTAAAIVAEVCPSCDVPESQCCLLSRGNKAPELCRYGNRVDEFGSEGRGSCNCAGGGGRVAFPCVVKAGENPMETYDLLEAARGGDSDAERELLSRLDAIVQHELYQESQ